MKNSTKILAIILILSVALSPYLFSSISLGNVYTTSNLTNLAPICGAGGTQIKIAGCPGGSAGGGPVTFSTLSLVLSGGTTPIYVPLGGGGLGSTTETDVQMRVHAVTTFSNVCTSLSVAPGGGNSLTIQMRDNAANTGITMTISGASVSACDSTHTFTNAADDLLDVSLVPSGVIALFTPDVNIYGQAGSISAGAVNPGTAFQMAQYQSSGSTLSPVSIPNCVDSGGNHVNFASATGVFTCGTSGGGGSTVSFAQPYATDGTLFYGPIFTVVKPLDTTWINQNGATRTTTNGSVFVSLPTTVSGTDNITCRSLVNASSPYTITLGALAAFVLSTNGSSVFAMAGDSGSGKLLLNGFSSFGSSTQGFGSYIAHATSPTVNLVSAQAVSAPIATGPFWYRIHDDGANIQYLISHDGINFVQVFTEADNAFLPIQPANEVGFCVENLSQSLGIPFGLTVFHLSLTTP
jgi:hypothetical protein